MKLETKNCGTVVIGVKTPFILRDTNLIETVTQSVYATVGKSNLEDGDVIAVTEAVVAIAQGNIVAKDFVAKEIQKLLGKTETLVVLWPIFSRNRFAPILDCVARAMRGKKVILQLNAFIDEQGNNLFTEEHCLTGQQKGIDERELREKLGTPKHMITGKDYLRLYREILEKQDVKTEIVCSNKVDYLQRGKAAFLVANVHGREQARKQLQKLGVKKVLTLQDICADKCEFGILGANGLSEDELKLFPGQAQKFVNKLVKKIQMDTGKKVEALVYGDGAYKDPLSGIWELADPVCAPGFTKKLADSPQEVKLKAVLNNQLKKETDQKILRAEVAKLKKTLKDNQELRFGTTPRRFHDLLASLADLTSGSGDRGTPVIYIKNYF